LDSETARWVYIIIRVDGRGVESYMVVEESWGNRLGKACSIQSARVGVRRMWARRGPDALSFEFGEVVVECWHGKKRRDWR
jgi:hypothetical protein